MTAKKSSAYSVIELKKIKDKNLSPDARLILCYLTSYANKDQIAYPSRARILQELAMSKTKYYKAYDQLEKSELIEVTRKSHTVNRYYVKLRPLGKKRFCIIYKDIVCDPKLSPMAKLLFIYITAFCPSNRYWNFRKSQITRDLGISLYLLRRSIEELAYHKLISVDQTQYAYNILNMYEVRNPKKAEETIIEGVIDPSKNKDTDLKKSGHKTSKKQDREENNYYLYNTICQSKISDSTSEREKDGQMQTKVQNEMKKDELLALAESEKTDCTKKELYFFVMALISLNTNKMLMTSLNDNLNTYKISLPFFAQIFFTQYRRKTRNIIIKNPIAYIRACLSEYIYSFTAADLNPSAEKKTHKGYAPTYDITEYESTSVLDEWDPDEPEEKLPPKKFEMDFDKSLVKTQLW